MIYTLPDFNLTILVWRGPTAFPPVGPSALTTSANLTPGRRGPLLPSFDGQDMFLLLPAGTDIRSAITGGANDTVEVPAGTGRYYEVTFVDDVAKGFANEHRFALLMQRGIWPTPIP